MMIEIPSTTAMINNITLAGATDWFQEFWPYALLAIGIVSGFAVIIYLYHALIDGFLYLRKSHEEHKSHSDFISDIGSLTSYHHAVNTASSFNRTMKARKIPKWQQKELWRKFEKNITYKH